MKILLIGFVGIIPASRLFAVEPGKFEAFCNDAEGVVQVMSYYQAAFNLKAASEPLTFSGMAAALASQGDFISKACNVILSATTAKSTQDVMNTSRKIAAMTGTGLDSHLDAIEDAISLADFATSAADNKRGGSLKDKLLNKNNHRRLIEPLQRNGIIADGGQAATEFMIDQAVASELEALNEQAFMGCHEPLDNDATKDRKGKPVDGSDGPLAITTVEKMGDKRAKDIDSLNRNNILVSQMHELINKMILAVSGDPKEAKAALYAFNGFVRTGVWTEVGYKAPANYKLDAKTDSVDNKFASQKVNNSKDTREVKTTYGVFWKEQGKGTQGTCDEATKGEKELSAFMIGSSGLLIDRQLKQQPIIDSFRVCPGTDTATVLTKTPLEMILKSIDDKNNEAKEKIKENLANCQSSKDNEFVDRIQKMKGVGDGTFPYARVDNEEDYCQSTPLTDLQAEPVQITTVNIKNFKDLVERYNGYMNTYVNQQYGNVLKENSLSTFIRKRIANDSERSLANNYPFSRKSRWNDKAGQDYISSEQRDFLSTYRPFSLCHIPEEMEKLLSSRSSEVKKYYSEGVEDTAKFQELYNACLREEREVRQNKDIFSKYIDTMTTAMIKRQQSIEAVVETDMLLGRYRGSNQSVSVSIGCKVDFNERDWLSTQTKAILMQGKSFQNFSRKVGQALDRAKAKEDAALEAAKELQSYQQIIDSLFAEVIKNIRKRHEQSILKIPKASERNPMMDMFAPPAINPNVKVRPGTI
ncbi:MAG: hypothetical protein EOP06_01590 [Proteobacteria bacterium]|nr:MAG: hypothetical protein EOP06_01590 [Pseudomonadota bacterium]